MARSIRWRLSLSYAGIALLTVVALGLVLLSTLRAYYDAREREYLLGNARAIGMMLSQAQGVPNLPVEARKKQVGGLAFMSQVRVRQFDSLGLLLFDTGPARDRADMAFGLVERSLLVTRTLEGASVRSGGGTDYLQIISIGDEFSRSPQTLALPPVRNDDSQAIVTFQAVRVAGTPFGFGLNAGDAAAGPRSRQIVSETLIGLAGENSGHIELSEGPAYGSDIVGRVASGWAISGAIAVLLASAVGWSASRRLVAPLRTLTVATQRMASGDLSARAPIRGNDELGALGEAFNEMAGQIEATILTLRRFVSDAAHQIHTPLTALRTDLESLADRVSTEGARRVLTRAQGQAARLECLVDELLQLSRLEAGAAHADVELVDLSALVCGVAELYAARAEQAEIAFGLAVNERPVDVRGNRAQLCGLVENLLDNALKFTPKGGAVTVSLQREGGWAELSVDDTGIGIPFEDLPLLFDRFHRGRNAAAYPGSGLGLAIVRATVSNHGGKVTARNTEAGACFAVQLPLVPPQHRG